jgi:hypothetical protein
MPVRKFPILSNVGPCNLRSPQGKTRAAAMNSRVGEPRRARARTPRTLNIYENTGSYRFFTVFRQPAGRFRTLKVKGLHRFCIAYRNDKKKGC